MARDSFNEQKNKNVYSSTKKKKKKTTKTVVKKPQSSSVSNTVKKIADTATSKPSTKPAYKNNKAKTAQKQQTDNSTRIASTIQKSSTRVADTARDMMAQRQKPRAGVETALQQKRDPLGINNKQTVQERYNRNNPATAKQRKAEEEKRTSVTSRNASEWNAVKNKSKEDQQAWFTKKATEAQERHAAENNRRVDKGTDNLATSAVKAAYHSGKGAVHSLSGALERSSMNDFYEGARIKYDAMRKGMSEEDAEKYGNEKAKKRQEARLAGFRQKTKIEQEKAEAIKNQEASKDSGPIPLRKWTVGAASFTGQRLVDSATGPYSLLTMGARVLEDERNSGKEKNDRLKKRLADSGQFTQEELDEEFDKLDKRATANAYASSGLELLSEVMFAGAGLSKKYLPEGASGLLDRAASKLAGRFGSSALGRVALGIGEETAEEWTANPVQAAVSNRLTGNRMQSLQEESIRRAYQGQAKDLKEIQATAADINSDAFLERAKSIYKESGASDEEATQIAELARDYFNADITGDSKTAEEKLNQITDILAGGENDMREKWTLNDALEVAGEMILSVGAEAAPGAISTAHTGSQYKANYGIDGVRKLAKVVENLDEEKSDRAKAIIDDIDSGKDISNTQVALLMEWSNNAALKAQDREITRDQLVQRKMRDEKLFVPIVDAEYNLAPATEERFEAITERVADLAQDEMGFDMSDVDAYAIGDVVAAYETGTISAEQMNELNIENPENRAVFEKATGIDLGQYTVKDSKGNIKVAASNTAMQQALFAKAADNYIESARIEQENWNDVERGRAFEELTSNMDGMGGVGIQRVLESVDPRNRGDFLLAGSVARRVYEHARNTNDEWDSVKKDFTDAFGADMNESMKYVFDMAKQAKAIAETKYYGKAVNKNSLNTEDVAVAEGKFTNESVRELKGSEIGVLTSVANELGINVIMTDSLDRNENGRYMPSQRTIMLNSANTMGDNLQAIFSHEVTHHLAVYAPDEYIKLSRLVMDRWYKSDADTYNAEIKRIQKLYKDAKDQDLTPEEALEELIADASHDFWSDEDFVNKVVTEEPTLAQSIINAIKDFLRKLRNMLSSGNITDEETREGLFAEIGAWDETYRLYMNAYNVARKDHAQQAIDEWQDEANKQNSPRLSVGEEKYSITTDKEDFIKGANLSKDLRDWAKEMGLDKLSKQPVKGPVIVSVRDLRTAWYEKNGRADEAAVINTALDKIGDSLTQLVGEYQYIDLGDALNAAVTYRTDAEGHPTSVILSCQVKNAEYEVNFDFTTICAKRLAMQKILERFIKTEGERQGTTLYDELKLDEEGLYKLRLILETAGFEVSCRGCFVEQNRYSQQNQARTIANDWNAALDEWAKDNGTEVTENFGLTTLDINNLDYEEIEAGFERYHELMKGKKTDVATKNRMLIDASPFFRKRMNASDYASMTGQRALMAIGESKKGGTNLYGLLKRGQSDSKQSVPFTAYNGEIALLPDNMKGKSLYDYLLSIGGARAQSASDFQIEFVYDYMQMVADLSARGLPMHMYTKVIELAELFGMTGIKINLSAMCDVAEDVGGEYAGLKLVDGKYEYNISDQSIDYEKAVELQKRDGYSKNIGIIMVTLSSQHMLKSLDDPDVRYIIGYHSSAMPVVVANMSNMGGATDYTKINKTNKLNEKGQALFDEAMEEAKGNTELEKYKEALRIFDEKIQEETAKKKKKPRRGNEYGAYMSAYGNNTADFNTYDSLLETKDARKTADKYLEHCMKNDLIPIYFPFAFHENYYKCEVYDFNMYDNNTGEYAPMESVQNIYPGLNMAAGETDTTAFTERVSEMMDERNRLNESLDSQYDAVFDEAKEELKYSITGDDYMDFDASGIDHNELTHRADAPMTAEQQRDTDYMAAVNSGNMDEAQRLVDEAAKMAGFDSPLLYHGTPNFGFTVFDGTGFRDHDGWFFSDRKDAAGSYAYGDEAGTYSVYLNFENPLVIDADGQDWTDIQTYTSLEARDRAKEIDARLDEIRDAWRNGTDNGEYDRLLDELDELDSESSSGDTDSWVELAKENGHDGLIIKNIVDYGASYEGEEYEPFTEYIAFNQEQIKSADTVTYAEDGSVIPLSERFDPENNDIRYSLPTQDSDGNILTDGQMEYFKNSQARDEQGRLVPVYHTTNNGGFTIFDPKYSEDRRSIFFTDSLAVSKTYGTEESSTTYECYLNLENPLIVDADYNAWDRIPITRQVGNISLTEDYDTNEVSSIAFEEGHDGVIIKNCRDWAVDDSSDFDTTENSPYSTIYIAFSSNQIKDINNENPTENPDIRYSIPSKQDVLDYIAANVEDINDVPMDDPSLEQNRQEQSEWHENFVRDIISRFDEGSLTFGMYLDEDSVKNHLIALMKQVMSESGTGKKYRADTLQSTIDSAKVMFYDMQNHQIDNAAETAWRAAQKIVDDIDYNDDLYVQYKGMRNYLDRRKIIVPEGLEYDESFAEFAEDNRDRMRFVGSDKKGTSVDTAYKYLAKKYPQLFPAEMETPIDKLLQIDYALDYTTPYREAYSSEEYSKLVATIAGDLMDIVSEGESYRTVADKLTDKYEGQIKAMKQRHEEALRKVKETEKEKRDATREVWAKIAQRWKDKYNERIQKDKAERKAKADKREHLKSYGHIAENYNKLCTWVLKPTKEKNVPEEFRKSLAEFLQALDLQTENSKKLEAKTGRVAQKTLKMRELKDRLNDLATRKGEDGSSVWDVDASIAFLLGKLSDKLDENGNSIDALDSGDIKTIDVFMQLLIRNIERYKQVKMETKNAEISDVGGRGVEFLKAKIDRDGEYRKRKGLPGTIAEINAAALTPAYLFDRMGPLKEMYDVLRHNGFDAYIRNEKMIMDRLEEILGEYYRTNKKGQNMPGSIIEEWRDERSAQTIELANGKTVTMSIAQIMSLRCLAKRGEQAMGHMMVGGIVVEPIQTTSKLTAEEKKNKGKAGAIATRTGRAAKKFIEERTKGVDESVQKYVLTYEDILNIISKLTPEQANIADKLQELMSVDMAKLGNEAHRELYGYEMFEEGDYFPIKVHGNERATDVNNIGEVIEKIKSFGFTKPLTPKASQAIDVGDIFSIVADHCNGMNLYNAYLVPITDFMKVLNYTHTFENGDVLTMKDAIEQAYGKDVLKYILNLMKDINGIKESNRGGLESIMNKALGRAKRTAVFGNVRVALQQPTAIVRAAAEINPKYIKGALHLDSVTGFIPEHVTATMEEMWKYCPIAQWKSWGFYDTYMGRDIEDVMMNQWSVGDKILAGYYGQLDNASWSIIWQAVKAEQAEKYPKMDHKSEEFLQICGRRASEVFDKTQVVDSTFHRSDAMRSKQIATKLFTAFMAEPTLTLNVFRAGLFNASEEWKAGNTAEAGKILGRAVIVIVVQAAVVSAAQAFADAWRGKDPGLPWDDDDDEEKVGYWWRWIHNFVYNGLDQLHLENNMYLVKDVTPYLNYMISQAAEHWDWNPTIRALMGWDQDYLYSQNNLVFAGLENTANGIAQLFKKLEKGDEYVDYKTKEPKKWYDIIQKIMSGIGTFTGIPVGTLMRDFKPLIEKFLPAVYAADIELMDAVANKMGYQKAGSSSDNVAPEATSKESKSDKDESADAQADIEQKVADYRESLSDNFTDEEKDELVKQYEKRIKKGVKSEEVADRDKDTMLFDAEKAAAGYEGTERDKRIWQSVSQGYKSHVESGDYAYIARMRSVVEQAGGNLDYFDEQIVKASKTALKKTIEPGGADTESEMVAQQNIRYYLQGHGVTQEEISSEIVYKCAAAKDLKVAFRINDEQAITESSYPLLFAGLTTTDYEKIYTNRNRIDLSKYDGKYKDRLKSTGTFVWPTQGTITSHFGARNAPTRGASSNHPAIDIGAPKGTPVVAADGGVVIYAGTNGGYGNSVGIKHDNGMVTYYNHLSAWNVNVGDTVGQGQQIANVGSTGISTGPHLDFKILDTNGKPVDPEMYLNKRS